MDPIMYEHFITTRHKQFLKEAEHLRLIRACRASNRSRFRIPTQTKGHGLMKAMFQRARYALCTLRTIAFRIRIAN
jgi:hypothetical protein